MDLFGDRWNGLSAWVGSVPAGKGAFDLGIGADSVTGVSAGARVGYGITSWLSAQAEAYANRPWGGGRWDYGAMAGLSGRF